MTPDDWAVAQHLAAVEILVTIAAERLNIPVSQVLEMPWHEIMAVRELLEDDVILAELEDGDQ